MNSDDDGSFADHREHILKTAKALVEDTKVLVAGAAGTQDQLAAAAQNAVTTICKLFCLRKLLDISTKKLNFFSSVQLADAVKRGACSLGSGQPDSQVMVINAVKDVAAALGELINATKLASGKPIHDPAMQDLKESARVSQFLLTNLSDIMSIFWKSIRSFVDYLSAAKFLFLFSEKLRYTDYTNWTLVYFIFFSKMILTNPSLNGFMVYIYV